MVDLEPIRALAAQHGAVLRREAVAVGWNDRDLRHACQVGLLCKVRHGCYVPADLWTSLDDRGRHLLLARAVLRSGEGQYALSHLSGALAHGVDVWDTDTRQVHLTSLAGAAGRKRPDAALHQGSVDPAEVTHLGDLPVLPAVRCAVEAASQLDVERGLVLLDSALRRGLFDRAALAATYEAMKHWPAMRHAVVTVRLADGRSASVGESRSRFVFWSQSIPMPELQYEIWHRGELLGITDFGWPERGLLGEFDGKVKYLEHLRPGEEPADALMREKRREDLIRRVTGFGFVRLTWADLARPMSTARVVREMLRLAA